MALTHKPARRHASKARDFFVLRFVAASAIAVLTFGAVSSYVYASSVTGDIVTQDVEPLLAPTRPPAPEPPSDDSANTALNILLIGSDSRSGNSAIAADKDNGMRGDTTVIMHISADRTRVDLLSIPRDLRVNMADCERSDGSFQRGWTAKFNTAFAIGGSRGGNKSVAAACTQNTIEKEMGIYIHYYAVVDFTGFIDMINALGGVPMCVPFDFYSQDAKLRIKKGPQVLTGKVALAWARARKGTSSNGSVDGTDLQRIERQHLLLAAVADLVLSKNLLTNIGELTDFVRAGAASMTMSPRLADLDYLVGLAYSLRNIDRDNIVFATVPWRYAGDGSGDVVEASGARSMYQDIIKDRPIKGKSVEDQSKAGLQDPEVTPVPTTSASPGATPEPTEAYVPPGMPRIEPGAVYDPSTKGQKSTAPARYDEDELLTNC